MIKFHHPVSCILSFLNIRNMVVFLSFMQLSFLFNWNKLPNWCNNFLDFYPDDCLELNRFPTFDRPLSRAQWLQWQTLVLHSYRGDCRVVFVFGPTGPTMNTARMSRRYESKTRGCHCRHWAPDDGRRNAPKCWAAKKRHDNKEKLLYHVGNIFEL
jgi:hypothetical protein